MHFTIESIQQNIASANVDVGVGVGVVTLLHVMQIGKGVELSRGKAVAVMGITTQ